MTLRLTTSSAGQFGSSISDASAPHVFESRHSAQSKSARLRDAIFRGLAAIKPCSPQTTAGQVIETRAQPFPKEHFRAHGKFTSDPININGAAQDKVMSAAQQHIESFFSGKDKRGGSLYARDVMTFNDEELEKNHRFIQFLFPTDKPSAFNHNAPILDGSTVLALRKKKAVCDGIDTGLAKLLQFYGLQTREGTICALSEQEGRIGEWLRPGSHHCLRMTRILRSLSLFGKDEQATALLGFLTSAVARLPAPACQEMARSLKHWKNALTDPVEITGKASSTSFMFPSKRLGSALDNTDAAMPDCQVKAALFDKQEQIFAGLRPDHTRSPLVAHFARPEFGAWYQHGKHFSDQVGSHANHCNVTVQDNYYFSPPTMSSHRDATPQASNTHAKEIYVDFANQAFGGAWRMKHGYAQEEIAFLENVGLGAVAQQAKRMQDIGPQSSIRFDQRKRFGNAFSTRSDHTPSPILVEGCVRTAQFGSYGGAASRLAVNDALAALTPVPPKTTTWLAIAAPDLRRDTGPYDTREAQFNDIFTTAHAGFSMSKDIAGRKPVEIRTGQFGCGVFRNDVMLSTAAQILAAKLVGIEQIHFHGYHTHTEGVQAFDAVRKTLEDCIEASLTTAPRETVASLTAKAFNALEASKNAHKIPRGP